MQIYSMPTAKEPKVFILSIKIKSTHANTEKTIQIFGTILFYQSC